MLEIVTQLLPPMQGTPALVVAALGALLGAMLWLAGMRFARGIVTLGAVGVGAVVGLALPDTKALPLPGGVLASALAVVAGAFAFFLPRLFVGLMLGAALSVWAAVVSWWQVAPEQSMQWPGFNTTGGLGGWIADCFNAIPPPVARLLPYTTGGAMVVGLILAAARRRAVAPVCFSVAGVTLLTVTALLAAQNRGFDWRGLVPAAPAAQAVMLLLLICVGVLVQNRPSPTPLSSTKGQ